MVNVLIHAPYELLSSHLAARYLIEGSTRVFVCIRDGNDDEFLRGTSSVLQELSATGEEDVQQTIASRLRMLAGTDLKPGSWTSNLRFSQVWYYSGVADPLSGFRPASLEELRLADFFRDLDQADFEQFNYTEPAFTGLRTLIEQPNAPLYRSLAGFVAEQCSTRRKRCRIVRTPLLFGKLNPLPRFGAGRDLIQFITTLDDFKSEIEERCPEYFEYQAIRYRTPGDSQLEVLSAREAAELMVRLAREPGAPLDSINISAAQRIAICDLSEWLGSAYELSLLHAGPEGTLNAIDRIFNDRLTDFCRVVSGDSDSCDEQNSVFATLDEPRAIETFTEIRRIHEQERHETQERVVRMLDQVERVTLISGGAELTYFVAGRGTPLVLLNALGQGLHYWYRLIDRLIHEFRIVVWEPRGVAHQPYACGLEQQIQDLRAIVQHEKFDACHLLAWCTGPKVATEFCVRHPDAVASMIFLNSTFKCFDRPDAAETAYEHNLESLCRVVDKHPAMALSVMRSLTSTDASKDVALSEMGSETLAASVVAKPNRQLQSHILAPFRDEGTTLNYVRQLMDFWSHDTLAKAGRVHVPVLLISSEYDEIASPEASEEFTRLLPASWHMQVPGATHYCLYDRPDLISQLIRSFCHPALSLTPTDIPAVTG